MTLRHSLLAAIAVHQLFRRRDLVFGELQVIRRLRVITRADFLSRAHGRLGLTHLLRWRRGTTPEQHGESEHDKTSHETCEWNLMVHGYILFVGWIPCARACDTRARRFRPR